jgi:hypothetical protein
LLAIGILLLTAAIVTPVYLRVRRTETAEQDVERMRRVFAAIAMYQEDHAGAMPAHLAQLHGLVEPADLVSPNDPAPQNSGDYPIEPALPDLPERTDQRISYAYLGNFIRTGKGPIKSWSQVTPPTGLLANVWDGSTTLDGSMRPHGSGPVQRVRMDGSLYVLPSRSPGDGVSFEDLFTRVVQ